MWRGDSGSVLLKLEEMEEEGKGGAHLPHNRTWSVGGVVVLCLGMFGGAWNSASGMKWKRG